jgi:hypothetical protein
MRTALVAVIATVAAAVAGYVLAAPATARVVGAVRLTSGSTTVHTANGKAWHYTISVAPGPSSSDDLVTERLTRAQTRPSRYRESHTWGGTTPASSLTFNAKSGKGTLKTPHSLAPLTTLHLTFRTTSRRPVSCHLGGSETRYFGTLTGRAVLRTHLRPGGTVGARHVRFPAGAAQVLVDDDCENPTPPARCDRTTYFQADTSGLRSLFGTAAKIATVELFQEVAIRPRGAYRVDDVVTRSAHLPAYDARRKTLQVWAAASGPFTGTARFTGGRRKAHRYDCVLKGVHHTQVLRETSNATYRNGADHPIVAHTSLVGPMSIPKTALAGYSFDTWS